jgi:membrane fusion protein (multidrug efflux system)
MGGPQNDETTDPAQMTSRFLLIAAACVPLVFAAGCDAPDGPAVRAAGGAGVPGAPAGGAPRGGGGRGMQGPVPVLTAVVAKASFPQHIEALGNARANEAVDVTSRTSNVVVRIRFEEGQRVERGAILAELDPAQSRAELAAAEAALVESRAAFERSRLLAGSAVLSHAQLDQIEAALKSNEAKVAAAKARYDDQFIRAPFGGRTGLRRVSVGSLVNPGTVITTLDDVSIIKLDFAVPETAVALLKSGLPITAQSAAYPGRSFAGRVASVDSRIDPVSRSVLVRAEVPNSDGVLKPGMFLTVALEREAEPSLMMPEGAVVPEQGRSYVFVVEGGKASRREVQLGRRRPGEVEVLAGLQENDRVVVEGTLKVRDGGQVREAGANGAPPPSDAAPGKAAGAKAERAS